MPTDSYNFSDDFQDKIIACIITFPDQFDIFGDLIQPGFFNGPLAVETVNRIKEFYEKYKQYPGFETLANFAHSRQVKSDPDRATQVFEYISGLGTLDLRDRDAIFDLIVPFAQERALLRAALVVQRSQMEGKPVKGGVLAMFERALAIGQNTKDLGIILQKDYAEIIDRYGNENRGVETGFQPFNDIWKNGWGAGWLVVPLAPPKRYKTTFCINLALNMVHDSVGSDVIYYACEIDQELAALRAMCSISGHVMDDLNTQKATFKSNVELHIQTWCGGNLLIKSYPSRAVTVNDLRVHARHVKRVYNLKPKAIIIDYADTVRSDLAGKDVPDYKQQADVYVQARRLGNDMGSTVIMPDRCKIEFVDKPVPNMKAFQGAFEKAGIVDVGIGLCQTDQERQMNTIRYFVFLNRHGPEGILMRGKCEPDKFRMTVDERIPYDPEEAEEQERAREQEHRQRRRRQPRANPDFGE